MKSLFITIAFAFYLSTTLSAQPYLDYSVARTDTNVQSNKTVPGSVWGGSTGMGTKWCNTQYYNGICIWRITDASVFPDGGTVQVPDLPPDDTGNTVQTTDNQKDNISSALSGSQRYIIVRSDTGGSAIIAFDCGGPECTGQPSATTVQSKLSGDFMFDDTNPGIIYARVNRTQIWKYTSTNWNTYTSSQVYDFASCLPQRYTPQWEGTWATAIPTSIATGTYHTWGSAFSSQPNQDTGYWALAYKEPVNGQGAGCASINTSTDQAYGWNGQLLGALDDGNGNPIPSFLIHDAGLMRSTMYFGVSPAPGCQACAPAYVWEIGTTHVRPCTTECDGHAADGFYDRASHKGVNSFMILHPLANPNSNLVGPLLTDYPPSGYDEHASWLNIPANEGAGLPAEDQGVDIYPILITTTLAGTNPQQYTLWGEDEIIGISANPADYGQNLAWRFGQTGNSGLSPNYTCQNAKGTVAEDGRGIIFTSDMASDGSIAPLGTDANGNARCDVFWMQLE